VSIPLRGLPRVAGRGPALFIQPSEYIGPSITDRFATLAKPRTATKNAPFIKTANRELKPSGDFFDCEQFFG
jgi:hypothetical protein